MRKAATSPSKEIDTFKQLNANILKPTDLYILGLFDTKKSHMFDIYSDFASQYGDDLQFYHSFKSAEILESLGKPKDVAAPSVLVVYHDLNTPKNGPRFKAFTKVGQSIDQKNTWNKLTKEI